MDILFSEKDRDFMQMALAQAAIAEKHGDVPVGAVILDNRTGEVISVGHNTREVHSTALGHAEINVIREACEKLNSWRLSDCTLYVTLEPCPMCAGAILAARIPHVVCGAKDPIAGAMGSIWALHQHPVSHTHTKITYGCMETESKNLLRDFFKNKRD